MRAPFLTITILGITGVLLAGCISGVRPADTYTDKSGKTSVIESDRGQCERSCNLQYSRCSETTAARTNSGINGPSGVYGASAECDSDLSGCLLDCKSR
jgi:hypothetical protein